MIEGFMYSAILKLWTSGKSKKEICRSLGHDIKTIRKIIKNYEDSEISTAPSIMRTSQLDEHRETIVKHLEAGLSNIRIFEKLQLCGITCSYSTLTNFTRKIKVSSDICVRFHSSPGSESQVDFGYVGLVPNLAVLPLVVTVIFLI